MISSKSILAKLLATENIRIEHKKVQTAYFDLKNRVMVLPIWKTTTPHLYDLLLGHEVGHALNTPSEGCHDCVTEKHKKGFKSFLNVIEDARIEKLMQVKFPGLKVSFKKGYSDLMEMDFFGVQKNNWDIDRLPLIDRINLHYKVGSYLNIQFSDYEKTFFAKNNKKIKEAKNNIKKDDFKSNNLIDQLCEFNSKRIYFETILKKLQKIQTN